MSQSRQSVPKGVWCTRAGVVESVHRVNAVVATDSGRIIARYGDVDWLTVYRSAAKPFQAIPLVVDGMVDRFGITREELALAAASHNGEPKHIAAVAGILEKVGFSAEALKLGAIPPLRLEVAESLYRSGSAVTPVHNNCSGQHAAMLGLAVVHGWPVDTYLNPSHPLQERMLTEMIRYTGLPREEIETMAAHPFMVGGTDRFCTALIQATEGRLIGKLGAEGVYGITVVPERRAPNESG